MTEDDNYLKELFKEKKRRENERKLFKYYPDEGPLNRSLYTKHLEFFEAGKTHLERAAIAANRVGKCIASDTVIESPYDKPRAVKDIKGKHWVWAWDGNKRVPALAEEPFTKPSEMVYRVWLASGNYVDCAAEHRFLSERGWIFLSDLFGYVPCLPASTLERGPSKSLEDAQRLMKKSQDFQDDYRQTDHSSDGRLLSDSISDLFSVPLQVDVQRHNLSWSGLGGLVDRCKRILQHMSGHLSILGDEILSAAQFAALPAQALCNVDQQYLYSLLDVRQSAFELKFAPQSTHAILFHQSQCVSLITPDGSSDTVVCYQPIGVQTIYDFHVPVFNNYCTSGMIHHNTTLSVYETTLHLTGLYPSWWAGKRFNRAVDWWAASDTSETTRDILQLAFLGKVSELGSGMIPKELIIGEPSRRRGVSDAIDTVLVRHVSGGQSQLSFKSYDQGREKFQGTKKAGISLDEEPPPAVYFECLTRLMSTKPEEEDGTMICTFTPLKGMSAVVLMYLNEQNPNRFSLTMGFDHVPHLSEASKKKLIDSFPPHERDARSKGIPQLGSGAIYPVPETDIAVDDFKIPDHWPRAYAMDVGWNRTAVGWFAQNPDTKVYYLYGEHYRGQAEPSIHAHAIKERGEWMEGVIDPAARGRAQKDGSQLLQTYIDLGLKLTTAFNGVESGIYEVWQMLSGGQLKIFRSCQNWFTEFRLYRRDDNGKIVKENDHMMDVTRYFVMSGKEIMKTKPAPKDESRHIIYSQGGEGSWMG